MVLNKTDRKRADDLLIKWMVLIGAKEAVNIHEPRIEECGFSENDLEFLEDTNYMHDARPHDTDWWYGLTPRALNRLKAIEKYENRRLGRARAKEVHS